MTAISEEHKLRRFLHVGENSASITLRGKPLDLDKRGLEPVNSLASAGRVNLPLQHCLAAEKGGFVDRRALMLVLAGCLKIDCKQTKHAVYRVLPGILTSTEEYFEFIYYHRKVFCKRPYGMGAGMRKFISKWYLTQDPYDLALEVTRIRSRHKWSHADLIKLARVRTQDPAVSAVLKAVVRGLPSAQEAFRDTPEAQPILEYMTCVKEINCCKDPETAIRLIDKHSFDVECLPTHLLNHSRVWEHAISRVPLRGVLNHLCSMARRGFLSTETAVLGKVLQCIKDPLALAASKLQPDDILTVIAQVESCWEHPPTAAHRIKTQSPDYVKISNTHPSLLAGLKSMFVTSLQHVPKVPSSVLVCVDCRPNITKGCWGVWALKAVRAMSVNIIALMKGGADVTLATIDEDRVIKQLPLYSTDTLEKLCERLEKYRGGVINPPQLIQWARETNKRTDLVICMTDSHAEVDRELLWTELVHYRNVICPVKHIYMTFCSKSLAQPVANKSDPMMLDIAGWGPGSIRIIQAFMKDCF